MPRGKAPEDLKEQAPCGMLIHYTVNQFDEISYNDINGRGVQCKECQNCSWHGICKPEPAPEPESKLERSTYVDIYNLIDDEMWKAAEEREAAADYLAKEDLNPRCVGAEGAIEKLRKSTKRMREMEDLLRRFEEQIEEPMK